MRLDHLLSMENGHMRRHVQMFYSEREDEEAVVVQFSGTDERRRTRRTKGPMGV